MLLIYNHFLFALKETCKERNGVLDMTFNAVIKKILLKFLHLSGWAPITVSPALARTPQSVELARILCRQRKLSFHYSRRDYSSFDVPTIPVCV